MKQDIITLQEVDSTNNYLHANPPAQPCPLTVVTAEYQCAGRGQRGNSWESERSQNLLFSFLIHPQVAVSHIFSISEAIALAISDALSVHVEGISVKWPNDIYWHEHKIAGILIETALTGKIITEAIIGVGVNINQRQFRSDAPNPISLATIAQHDFDRQAILSDIISRFTAHLRLLDEQQHAALHERYMSRLYRREGYHPFRDAQGEFQAQIHAVEPTGHLILSDTSHQLRRYAFKEVEFIHPPLQQL